MKILKVDHLTQRFGELAAVNDLSFEVNKGEIFGIAGPNGAGKSVLFNVITGLYRGTGHIVFDGEQISGLKPHQICRRGIARTFQIPRLFPTLPVIDNVRVGAYFGAQLHGAQNEETQIKIAIQILGLQRKADVIAANLNLFDKKRTMVAAALATKPKLLLVDEPIGGLSPIETKELMALIQKVNKELDLTIIIIEHLMKVLVPLCDRLMIMENGAKIALGPPKEVIKDEKVIEVYLGRSKHA